MWKKDTALVVVCALVLQLGGCGVWMIDKGDPYKYAEEKTSELKEIQKADKPYETSPAEYIRTEKGKEVIVPEHWEIVDDGGIPAGKYPYPIFDRDPVWKVNKNKGNTFLSVEEYANKNGYAILKNMVDFPAKMTSGHQPAKIYLIPKGKYILYKAEPPAANGDIILTPIEVPSCRNELIWAPKLKWVPLTKVRIDKEIWVQRERYRDIQILENNKTLYFRQDRYDAGAIALAAVLGILGGIGLGWLFFHGATTAVVQGAPCAAGTPAPR